MAIRSERQGAGAAVTLVPGVIQCNMHILHTIAKCCAGAIALAATGCAPVKTSFERPTIEVWPERVVVPIPVGWKVAAATKTPDVEIEEIVAPGETVDAWTQMFTVVITRGKAEPNLEGHAQALISTSQGTCSVPVVGTAPSLAADHSYPALVQFISCNKLNNHDYGEAVLVKFLSVQNGYYAIQWSWRFASPSNAATLASAATPVSAAQRDAAKQVLAATFVCDSTNPQAACPSPRTN